MYPCEWQGAHAAASRCCQRGHHEFQQGVGVFGGGIGGIAGGQAAGGGEVGLFSDD